MEGWTDFFVAEVGAAAALAGLLVVAMSINIKEIMALPTLPPRAAQTLIIIAAALVLASLGLFPRQSLAAFGWEAVVTGIVVALTGALDTATKGQKDERIFLRADKAVSYGDLMAVMNLLRDAGYLKIALVGLDGRS